MKLKLSNLPVKSDLIEHRIGGWIEKALEICGCQDLVVALPTSIAKGDAYTTYDISWK